MRLDKIFTSSFIKKLGQDETSTDPALIVAVAEFLLDHPDPEDEEVHEWAEENGIEVDEVEKAAYFLATRYAKFLLGGKSKGNISVDGMDPEEMQRAIEIEKEHTDDPVSVLKIISDHRAEDPRYYPYLVKMERELKRTEKE